MEVKKLPFKEFKKIYSRVPRLCVEVIVKTKTGIVLTKRNIPPAKGSWHIPGGTILKGETLEQAVKRKASEELGLKVNVKKNLGVIEYSFKKYFSQPIGIAFLVEIVSGQLRLNKDDSDIRIFKKLPKNIIKEQKVFLKNKLKI